jgi:hypothetical protein
MRPIACLACAVVLVLGVTAAPASAQTDAATMWRHGSTLSGFAGAAGTDGGLAPMGGGAVGWEITPRLAIEGSGTWYEWGSRSHAFAAALRAQVAIRTARPVVPFVAGGIGLYRASIALSAADLPTFYRRRMFDRASRSDAPMMFTDPSVVFGGGVNIYVTNHVVVRPDFGATVVMRDRHAFVLGSAAVHLAYHFDEHPITP